MPSNPVTTFLSTSSQRARLQLANAVLDYAEAVLRGDVIDRYGSGILGDMESLLAKFAVALFRCKQPLGPILCGRIHATDSEAAALFFSSVLKRMRFAATEEAIAPQIDFSMRERLLTIRSLIYVSVSKPSDAAAAPTDKLTESVDANGSRESCPDWIDLAAMFSGRSVTGRNR
jgi:hypothetical protein